MAVPLNLMPLPGSALATPSARCLGPLPPLEQLDVILRLRRPVQAGDAAAVVRFVLDHGLRILDVDDRAPSVAVRGSVLALSRAFGVQLRAYAGVDGPFRARRGMIHVPVTLAGVIIAVDGLDQRPRHPEGLVEAPPVRRIGARTSRRNRPAPPSPSPSTPVSPPSIFSFSFPFPVSAAPRTRTGRACAEPAGQAGSPVPLPVAGEDHVHVVPGGCDGDVVPAGLAVVLQLPARPAPVPFDHAPAVVGASPLPLAPARARRRGPLVAAAAAQRDRRLARQFHPAGVDRS
jgi:hypothetical protein